MNRCPDQLTWQAVIDEEIDKTTYEEHLVTCAICRKKYEEIAETVNTAERLQVKEKLPVDIVEFILQGRETEKPYPAGLLGAIIFVSLIMAFILITLETGVYGLQYTESMIVMFSILFDNLINLVMVMGGVAPGLWVLLALFMVAIVVFFLGKTDMQEGVF